MIFAIITLLSALSLAAVADWFSIIGFMTIYAASPTHALIMGVVLALAKLVTTSWVYRNWEFVDWKIKTPLIGFVVALMVATSIGTYGFLTKSHLDQTGGTIDNGAKVERLDQQIAREKSVILDDEKVIVQLDATINSYIGKDRTDKSLAVRKSQTPQRKQLRDDIDAAQKRIDAFSDEKLRLQSEVRKQQLDVGPIRYIAELFYGVAEDATQNIEAAVRIFTLLITLTLDPLAVVLLVAANHTLLRLRDEKKVPTPEHKDPIPDVLEETTVDNAVFYTSNNEQDDKSADIEFPELNTDIEIIILDGPLTLLDPESLKDSQDIPPQDILYTIEESIDILGSIYDVKDMHEEDVPDMLESCDVIVPTDNTPSEDKPSVAMTIIWPTLHTIVEERDDIIIDPIIAMPPSPDIRSPRLTRVGISEEAPVHTDSVSHRSAINHSIIRELSGTHFIPQKVNEDTVQVENIIKSAEISETEDMPPSDGIGHKYPVVLSWLTEFKRS